MLEKSRNFFEIGTRFFVQILIVCSKNGCARTFPGEKGKNLSMGM
jgi:hypothetical protein